MVKGLVVGLSVVVGDWFVDILPNAEKASVMVDCHSCGLYCVEEMC